jgi:hypothetical protein
MRRLLAWTMSLGMLATMVGCYHTQCPCIMGVCDCGPDWNNCNRYGPPAQAAGHDPVAPGVAHPVAVVERTTTAPKEEKPKGVEEKPKDVEEKPKVEERKFDK